MKNEHAKDSSHHDDVDDGKKNNTSHTPVEPASASSDDQPESSDDSLSSDSSKEELPARDVTKLHETTPDETGDKQEAGARDDENVGEEEHDEAKQPTNQAQDDDSEQDDRKEQDGEPGNLSDPEEVTEECPDSLDASHDPKENAAGEVLKAPEETSEVCEPATTLSPKEVEPDLEPQEISEPRDKGVEEAVLTSNTPNIPAQKQGMQEKDIDDDEFSEPTSSSLTTSRWARLLRPRHRRAEYLVAALCAAFGFALAVSVAQTTGDQLASLRQDELVRILDEVTQRGERLEDEVRSLEQVRDELESADGADQAARERAEQRAQYEGILSGRLQAQGPGVTITITSRPRTITPAHMFNTLEELRNAGVEAQQINGVRIVASTHFTETADGHIVVDGTALESPYVWTAIGDPATIDRALEIPGGALPTLREAGATAQVSRKDHVLVDATRTPQNPDHASTVDE